MPESVTTVLDLLTRNEFLVGGVVGFLALSSIALLKPPGERPRLDWGVVLVTAFLVVLGITIGFRPGVVVGLALLSFGGWLARPPSGESRALFGWMLLVAGAISPFWIGFESEVGWVRLAGPLVAIGAGVALARWSHGLSQVLVGPMLAVSAFGIWVTVPETELARALLGVGVPMALATLPPIRARFGFGGAFAVAGMVAWVVGVAGEARPGSIVGGWACLGVLVILPFMRQTSAVTLARRPIVTIAAHTLLVALVSRVYGLWESAGAATLAVLATAVAAYLVLGWLAPEVATGTRRAQGPR